MQSIRHVYKIGTGPSSSHSMGPALAAKLFVERLPHVPCRIGVTLHGALAATGKGHLTDAAIIRALHPIPVDFEWRPQDNLPLHPNAMTFKAWDLKGGCTSSWRAYSVGGGRLRDEDGLLPMSDAPDYPARSFKEIMDFCDSKGTDLWAYIGQHEKPGLQARLDLVLNAMFESLEAGLHQADETLPGPIGLRRRAQKMLKAAQRQDNPLCERILVSAYALAVAEENASGGQIVTAPTCGSAGVLPAMLYFFRQHRRIKREQLLRALAVAGLVASTIELRASISGAEVGCQGEIGAACAMAAAAAAMLFNGSNAQIEYAAEMGLEHFLGLTCDPVGGLVQVPCIERNAFAAMRALDCAAFSLATDGQHCVSLDDVIDVMNVTGRDMQVIYRETAQGGLAKIMQDKLLTGNQ